MICIKCLKEFEGRPNKKFCNIKCKNYFGILQHRKKHNLHPNKVGRPVGKWIAISDMTEADWLKWNESQKNKFKKQKL